MKTCGNIVEAAAAAIGGKTGCVCDADHSARRSTSPASPFYILAVSETSRHEKTLFGVVAAKFKAALTEGGLRNGKALHFAWRTLLARSDNAPLRLEIGAVPQKPVGSVAILYRFARTCI